jgi:hypothetical protein
MSDSGIVPFSWLLLKSKYYLQSDNTAQIISVYSTAN